MFTMYIILEHYFVNHEVYRNKRGCDRNYQGATYNTI